MLSRNFSVYRLGASLRDAFDPGDGVIDDLSFDIILSMKMGEMWLMQAGEILLISQSKSTALNQKTSLFDGLLFYGRYW